MGCPGSGPTRIGTHDKIRHGKGDIHWQQPHPRKSEGSARGFNLSSYNSFDIASKLEHGL
jgi:hypothetical protein